MQILAFGIVKDIFDNSSVDFDFKEGGTIDHLKILLEQKFPRLSQLGSYMIALNNEYASPWDIIHNSDELAIIPPVSGG